MTNPLLVTPGPGTVARFDGLMLWAGPGASTGLLRFLVESARNLGPSPRGGRLIAEHTASVLATRDPEPAVPFVTVGPAEGGYVILLHGPVQAWDGQQWIAPTPHPGWLQATLAAGTRLVAGPMGVAVPPPAADAPFDLERGVVPGGGLNVVLPAIEAPSAGIEVAADSAAVTTVVPEGHTDQTSVLSPSAVPTPHPPASEPAAAPAPLLATDPHPPADPVDLRTAPTQPSTPLPRGDSPASGAPGTVVRGVRCPQGHFNHPDAPACVRCATPIGPDDRAPISGPRPALGALVLEDGSVFGLDRGYLVGSDPERDPTVSGGLARPLRLDGEEVSAAHAEVRLTDWAVTVIDRGSGHGTFVLPPGEDTWDRLTPFQPFPVRPGTHVAVGRRVFTLTSPWP